MKKILPYILFAIGSWIVWNFFKSSTPANPNNNVINPASSAQTDQPINYYKLVGIDQPPAPIKDTFSALLNKVFKPTATTIAPTVATVNPLNTIPVQTSLAFQSFTNRLKISDLSNPYVKLSLAGEATNLGFNPKNFGL